MRLVGVLVVAAVALSLPLGATVLIAESSEPRGLVPSTHADTDIPPDMLALYQDAAAARCPGLPWPVLAGIGKVETDHARNVAVSTAGAVGPMQFLPSTWARYGVDATGDGVADVTDPVDAVHGAARYLCANGGDNAASLRDAVFAYNHASWYVDLVLEHADTYADAVATPNPPSSALADHPNLSVTQQARRDLTAGRIDGRVVALLGRLAERHQLGVSVLRSGHTKFIAGTRKISLHWCGQAVDVWRVDGQTVSPANPSARAIAEWLQRLDGPLRPREVGSPWGDLPGEGFFTDARHQGHLHIGYGPRCTRR